MKFLIIVLAFIAAFVITFVSMYLTAVALVVFVNDMYLKIKQYRKRV